MNDWRATQIWKHLDMSLTGDHIVRSTLSSHMPRIEQVLTTGGTTPLDFTLHDSGHAFRVAELMFELVPCPVRAVLSAEEWGLLLFSAYLHDIGMSPARAQVEAVRCYLYEGDNTGLDPNEFRRLRIWLAEKEGGDFTPPVQSLGKLEELLTYYCRDRHNEWSSAFTGEQLSNEATAWYHGWVEDLTHICESHHFGENELRKSEFNIRPLSGNRYVNRRYLAALLRVADILENDPERVPPAVLEHRAIATESVPHWRRPALMTTQILGNGLEKMPTEIGELAFSLRRITTTAWPTTAIEEKGIRETVHAMQQELELCDRLQRDGCFKNTHQARIYSPITGTFPRRSPNRTTRTTQATS